MESRLTKKLKKIQTGYVRADISRCKVCWKCKCIDVCPNQVIGQVAFGWHKYIVIENGENCTGCNKCIKACPRGVFFESESR